MRSAKRLRTDRTVERTLTCTCQNIKDTCVCVCICMYCIQYRHTLLHCFVMFHCFIRFHFIFVDKKHQQKQVNGAKNSEEDVAMVCGIMLGS